MTAETIYYTYMYVREDGTPYYIGKGKNNRAFQHHSNVSEMPTHDRIIIVKDNITDEQSRQLEVELIAEYGRIDVGTGTLENKNFGGGGGDNSEFIDYEKASVSHKKNVENGRHNFLGSDNNKSRVDNGTHNFLGGNIQREMQLRRIKEGTATFITNNPTKTKWKCSITGRISTKSRFTRIAREQMNLDKWPHLLVKVE